MKQLLPLALVAVLVCPGCGDPEEGHVWKEKTDMIDKAGEVENILLESSQQRRQQTEELTR